MRRRVHTVGMLLCTFMVLTQVCDAQAQDLRNAIMQGNFAEVKALLDNGADSNEAFATHETPLHLAARHDRNEIIELLLDRGADPMRVNRAGDTPLDIVLKQGMEKSFWSLYRALETRDPDIESRLPVLFDEVVSRDHRVLLESMLDPEQALPIHSGVESTLYFKAAERGSVSVLRYFAEHDQDLNQTMSDSQWTALHFLALGGHRAGLQWMLTQNAAVNVRDVRGMTPLHLAVFMDHGDVAQTLLEAGAEVDAVDEHQRTPLHIAAHQGYGALIQLLLKHGASPELKTAAGDTPLDIVRARQFTALRTFFPVHTATPPVATKDFMNSMLALRVAIQQQQASSITPLLESNELKLDAADRYGLTLLHYASDVGDHSTIRALLNRGVEVNQADTRSRWTPLMYAVANGHGKAVEALLEAGADVQATNSIGWTALHLAEFYGLPKLRTVLEEAGAADDVRDELGHTPGMLALTGSQYRNKQLRKLGHP